VSWRASTIYRNSAQYREEMRCIDPQGQRNGCPQGLSPATVRRRCDPGKKHQLLV
jgi:hypothetical protein